MNCSEGVSTELFRMKGGIFAMKMMSLYGKSWLIASGIMLAAAILATIFIDLRWGIIALMLIFIVTPGVFAFLYYYHAFRPLCVLNVIKHRILFLSDRMVICAFPDIENEASDNKKEAEPICTEINYAEISGYHTGIDSVTITMHDRTRGFVWLPISTFPDNQSVIKAFDSVISGMRCRGR